jgi:hypothetical protein
MIDLDIIQLKINKLTNKLKKKPIKISINFPKILLLLLLNFK